MHSSSWLRQAGERFRRHLALPVSFAVISIAGLGQASAWEFKVCADPSIPPFSTQDRMGYENAIAQVIADALGAELEFTWWPQGQSMINDVLRAGECDVIMGMPDGAGGVITTLSYYRSPFVFVEKAGDPSPINNYDDPRLTSLRIGVQPADGPSYNSLQLRGLGNNITREFQYLAGQAEPLRPAFEAVMNGEIDVALTWGPAAGYYASVVFDGALVVSPVDPPFDIPFTPMFINMAMATRIGDESFRDLLDIAIADAWEEIYAVFEEFHVPVMDLPRPTRTIEGL